MKKSLSFVLAILMAIALVPAPALAEAADELDAIVLGEEGDVQPGNDTQSNDEVLELGEPADLAVTVQDNSQTTPQFHIQTAQIQDINGTTLATGPNYKHVATTYYYDLTKGDYPVPYGGNGIPLANGLANYMQASGIYFPGDKIVIIGRPDPNPNDHGDHGQPGITFVNSNNEYIDFQTGDTFGPLCMTGTTTRGSWHAHSYVTEITVVGGPVMFSTASGNSGSSGWADSNPADPGGYAQDFWSISTWRYVELPEYHPIEYHYYCGDTEIPASDLAGAQYYSDQLANPEVIWAEDLSVAFVPYVTWGTEWENNKSGNVFTFSRPYIEGYYYQGMQIGQNGDNFWCWDLTDTRDAQSYTARFRYSGDMDYNWTFPNQKVGSEADPIIVRINYTRDSEYPSTITVNANGGTINGLSEHMFNFRYYYDYDDGDYKSYRFKTQDHMPTRDGYVFDGWYADAASTQVITPAADNGMDLSGGRMYADYVDSYLMSYGRQLRSEGAHHFCVYAKWAPQDAKHISNLSISNIVDKNWTGSSITQDPVIKDGDKTLVKGTDYRILGYENNVNVTSSAKITLQGIGSYRGIHVQKFSINRKPVTINFDLEYTTTEYDGTYKKPAIKNFTCSEAGLAYNDTNFYTSYSYNCDASTASRKAKVTIQALGNYTGSATKEFTITKRKATPTVELGFAKTTYTGEKQYAPVTVKVDGKTLSSYYFSTEVTNNIEVGTATVTVTLQNNYEGTGKATFQIVPATNTFSVAIDESEYTGDERIYDTWYKYPNVIVKAGSMVLTKDTDYTVDYKDNYYPGTATVLVTGIGAYAGYTGSTTFQILKPDIGTADYAGKVSARRYTGQAVTPKPSLYVEVAGYGWVTLHEGEHYTVVSYQNNVNVGQATMTIKGMGYFTGTATLEFSIEEREGERIDISDATVSYLYETYAYTGKPIRPDPYVYCILPSTGRTVRLTRGTDYDITYKNNVEVGTATLTVTGTNDYVGSRSWTFQIVDPEAANLEDVSGATVTVVSQTYTGKALTPSPTVKLGNKTLVNGTDYTVAYANNKNAGTAAVTITGVRSAGYKGTKKVTFSIGRAAISKATAATIATQAYTGKALTPAPTLTFGGATLVKGTDYTLSYANNTKAGTATITVTGKGNFTGTKAVTFKIAKLAVTLAKTKYAYTGKAITPAVTVKMGSTTLKKDTHYTVSYASGRKSVGTYNVTVTLKGSYAGKTTVSFTIVPKGTTISKIKPASKALTVAWKKQATQTTGYQVQYSLKKNFSSAKTVTVSKTKTTSKKLSSLKAKKAYYVRVRTYKKIGSTTYYSTWSAASSAKTK